MLLYLDHAWVEKAVSQGRMNSMVDLYAAVKEGAVQRNPAQDHDRLRHPLWPVAHYVVNRSPKPGQTS